MSLAYAILAAPHERSQGGPSPRLPELLDIPNAELVARLQIGDERAFDSLYRTYYPRLVALARAYVVVSVAEELTQDVFARIWERRAKLSPDDEIGVYLYAAVRNRAISAVRHEHVVERTEQAAAATGEAVGMGDREVGADVLLERDDLHVAIERVLNRLPEGMRTAFTLRWIHELSYAEVARVMNITEAAARKQVSRARDAVVPVLRHFVEEEKAS